MDAEKSTEPALYPVHKLMKALNANTPASLARLVDSDVQTVKAALHAVEIEEPLAFAWARSAGLEPSAVWPDTSSASKLPKRAARSSESRLGPTISTFVPDFIQVNAPPAKPGLPALPTGMFWVDGELPPPRVSQRGTMSWPDKLAVLKEAPGRWAMIGERANGKSAREFMHRVKRSCGGWLEVEIRPLTPDQKFDAPHRVYARALYAENERVAAS